MRLLLILLLLILTVSKRFWLFAQVYLSLVEESDFSSKTRSLPKHPPDPIILDSLVSDNLMLGDELLAKAL